MEKYKIGIVPMLGDEAVTRMVITSLEEPQICPARFLTARTLFASLMPKESYLFS